MADANHTNQHSWTMRGESMTRIETFFAAACAFAVTMVVISVGTIPHTLADLLLATKQIPAFTASFAVITWIWHTHSVWSRRFGLEDTKTVVFSCLLILLVLIYMYPLRIMMQALFAVISDGFLPSLIRLQSEWDVRFIFILFGLGFLLLSINFVALYWHGKRSQLVTALSEYEKYQANTEIIVWLTTSLVCITTLLLSVFLPIRYIGWAGYSYFLLFPLLNGLTWHRSKKWS
ncbi:TMEM175 family protein [Rheinheimera baltica]|uniref:TMEM175 family protein n=1 Tax=Rheinheimera baltica TaxID=67576 RepID=A0ABT9HTZ6_9GAMM|nr:TMEM175 family protein [Rheinheimera baltica]MDP5134597.1 TMEM175 family protein [Rheinheimera baltica]